MYVKELAFRPDNEPFTHNEAVFLTQEYIYEKKGVRPPLNVSNFGLQAQIDCQLLSFMALKATIYFRQKLA